MKYTKFELFKFLNVDQPFGSFLMFVLLLLYKTGDLMKTAAGEFADDPCSSVKRGNMVRAARALLSAVTRLLILADMADVYKLLVQLKVVSTGPCL